MGVKSFSRSCEDAQGQHYWRLEIRAWVIRPTKVYLENAIKTMCTCVYCTFVPFSHLYTVLDSGLWSGTEHTKRNDGLCGYQMVPCTGDNVELDALQSNRQTGFITLTPLWSDRQIGLTTWLGSVVQWLGHQTCGHQVSTRMGDRLWAGKPSRYVTSHIGQFSLPSLWGRKIEHRPLAGVKAGCGYLCRVEGNTV